MLVRCAILILFGYHARNIGVGRRVVVQRSLAWRIALIVPAALTLQGCLVRTALDVATAPVRVASKAVDLATTSQSEADEKRGRALRLREEELGKLERRHDKHRRECERGDNDACAAARADSAAIERLLSASSAPPSS